MVGALISSIFGAGSQAMANDAYLEGVEKTNEANYRMFKENQQYERQMMYEKSGVDYANWLKQQEYNSPLMQRQRLEAAGYNPSLLSQGGNATGVATSAPAPASVNSVPTPQFQAPQQTTPAGVVFAQNLMDGMLKFAQARNVDSQTDAANSKLPYELSALKDYASMQGMTKEFMKEFGKPMMQLDMAIKEGEVRRQTQSNFLNSMIQNDVIKTYQAQRVLTQCNAKNAQILNNYFDDSTQLDIAKKINEVALLASQKNWTDKQIDVAIADIAQKYSQVALNNSIARLNNQEFQFNEDTRDLRIAGLTQDNLGKLYDNEQKRHSVSMIKSTFFDMLENARLDLMYNRLNLGNEIILQGTRRNRLTDPYTGNFFKYSFKYFSKNMYKI